MSTDLRNADAGREDREYASSVPGDSDPDRAGESGRGQGVRAKEVQPGTSSPGKSWHSRSPVPGDEDDKLEQALKDSFPASDPPGPAQPSVTGWDLKDDEKKKSKKNARA